VGRIYKPIKCWKYLGSISLYPALKCKIRNLTGFEYGPIDIPIDTRFSGSILVPSTIYEYFKISELPPKYWRRYVTLTGELTMRSSRGYNIIDDIKIETLI